MFQINKVEQVTGLTRRQLHYWNQTGLVEASITPGVERKPSFWSFSDLVALRTVRRLREQNVSVQKIRKVLEYAKKNWADLEKHLAELTFYVLNNGREVLLLGPGEVFPVSSLRAQGQTVFILPGQDVAKEVNVAIHQLYDIPLTPEEAEESSKAWDGYLKGNDSGVTLDHLHQELLESRKANRA